MSTTNTNITGEFPTEPPRLHVEVLNGKSCVRFPRRKIDGVAVRELYETAATMSHEREPKLLIDLDGVTMVSSGVMGILVTIQKLFRHVGGQLHIATADPLILQQFEITNLHLLLKLFNSREDAVTNFK